MEVTDSHVHLWDPAALDYAWLADIPTLNKPFLPPDLPHTPANTRAAVFVQADCRADQALKEVDWVSSLSADWPKLAGIVAFAPISRGNKVAANLNQLLQRPLVRGVRELFQDQDASFILDTATLAGARQVAAAGMTFDACIRFAQLPALAEFADRVPELVIVLDHMGKPPIASGAIGAWSTGMRELARRPNVVVKISGAGAEADRRRPLAPQALPFIAETLQLFGAERCMIGSDWPVSLSGVDEYQEWINTVMTAMAGATESEREAVAHGTAARTYRLETATTKAKD
ncbi:L-fuconolactonase [Arthrobacter ulcerisalmonis]|nr:amidohydrolase family protein [Arthrobacter ulcerisalmonis]MDQ0665537.1 L-fuconolactonase [Arthrobacter ulcerisalmonis]